jgi:adenosylhomocysteine nucleosidase
MLKLLEAHRSKISAYKVFRGCLLSGNAVIRSVQYRDAILRWSQTVTKNVVGGQMEGAGLLALSPRNDPKWLVVKGISDFADEAQRESAEQHRQIACRNASNFVLDALLSEQSPNQSRGATHVH